MIAKKIFVQVSGYLSPDT